MGKYAQEVPTTGSEAQKLGIHKGSGALDLSGCLLTLFQKAIPSPAPGSSHTLPLVLPQAPTVCRCCTRRVLRTSGTLGPLSPHPLNFDKRITCQALRQALCGQH